MKILMLYSPRSGTNSICDYFLKQNPDYIYLNQPWSKYQEGNMKKEKYEDCLKYDKILIKSEITAFKNLKISNEKLLSDFDKVILFSRKNKKEQAISFIIAENNRNFLSKEKRKYFLESITENEMETVLSYLNKCEDILTELNKNGCKLFYYEDIYYNNFEDIFKILNIKFIQQDFEEILNVKNKYFSGEWESKKNKTIF